MDTAIRNCRQVTTFPSWFERVMEGVYIGTKGDVTFVMEGGAWVTLQGLQPGVWHRMRFTALLFVSGKAAQQTFVGCCL
jgi:hypothetical protein